MSNGRTAGRPKTVFGCTKHRTKSTGIGRTDRWFKKTIGHTGQITAQSDLTTADSSLSGSFCEGICSSSRACRCGDPPRKTATAAQDQESEDEMVSRPLGTSEATKARPLGENKNENQHCNLTNSACLDCFGNWPILSGRSAGASNRRAKVTIAGVVWTGRCHD